MGHEQVGVRPVPGGCVRFWGAESAEWHAPGRRVGRVGSGERGAMSEVLRVELGWARSV